MMKIYDFYAGPSPARVRIALGELGLESQVRFVPIDLFKGEHRTPAFLEKNYSGTLPVLELADGTFISECTAITQYLDALNGKPILTGSTPVEQGIIHMMNKRAEIEFVNAVNFYFHHSTPGLGPDLELNQNDEWGLRQRDKAVRGMRYFDSVLQKQPFVAGDTFTMADITVISGMLFLDFVKLAVPEECTALKAWWTRMQERPSYQNRLTL